MMTTGLYTSNGPADYCRSLHASVCSALMRNRGHDHLTAKIQHCIPYPFVIGGYKNMFESQGAALINPLYHWFVPINASGFPGNLVDAYREGMMPRNSIDMINKKCFIPSQY